MSRLIRVAIVAGTAVWIAWLWYGARQEIFRDGMPSITEDADFALLVRLTGFLVIVAVVLFFAVKHLTKK
ncbi:MAG TPA: hypothetical protein VMB77_12200 [Syntrophales bacterium]|nr:hypothetical protein [Syntrophales bacterium]